MGLQPVQLRGRHRAKIQAVDVHGVDKRLAERGVVGDRAADERRADGAEHLRLGALDDGDEGKQGKTWHWH